jgi:hypothetical protein
MSIATDTAAEYYALARKEAEAGHVREAIYYGDKASALLLRQPVEIEAPGTVVGEHMNYEHLGRTLAAKARLVTEGMK